MTSERSQNLKSAAKRARVADKNDEEDDAEMACGILSEDAEDVLSQDGKEDLSKFAFNEEMDDGLEKFK